jgi:alpha-glucoside transport system substrate-binding protein
VDQVVSFGNWVRRRRKILDMTQADLAQKANCSLSMLRKIESDQRRPSEQLAKLLADQLNIEESQHAQFMQLARGQYVSEMPVISSVDTSQPEDNQNRGQQSAARNPLIISSGAALLLIIFGLLFSGAFNNWQAGTDGPAVFPAEDLAGNSVVIEVGFDARGLELLQQAMIPFVERTGINAQIRAIPDVFDSYIAGVAEVGNPPDIVSFPQPGYLADFAHQGHLVALDSFMDEVYLRQQYTDPILELGTVDGAVYGAHHLANLKGLIWYAKDDFDAAGYELPQTWEELMALSQEIAADGRTPWCIGIENGTASGWIGTDWAEAILLRTAPPETYDAWVTGRLPFDSPEIRRVFTLMAPIWLADEMVYGGRENIAKTPFRSAGDPLFTDPPGCYLLKGATFSPGLFPEEVVYGEDYDFFMLPAIDPLYGEPLLGAGSVYAMFNDRPEVREVMRYLTTGESIKPFAETGKYVSSHRDVPLEWYATPIQLRFAQLMAEAEVYRFDGSDLMPGETGFQFWQSIIDWVEGEELDAILQEIDASWPDDE